VSGGADTLSGLGYLVGGVDTLSGSGVLLLSLEMPRRDVGRLGRRMGPLLPPVAVDRQGIAIDEWSEDTVDDRDPLLPTARADVAEDDAGSRSVGCPARSCGTPNPSGGSTS
jgi:hypothetical protein